MPFLMLRKEWPTHFRRTLSLGGRRGERTLIFSPGVACEVEPAEYLALKPDIGGPLQVVELDANGEPRLSKEC